MIPRVSVPGLRTGLVGRVFLIHYSEKITLPLCQQAQLDYEQLCADGEALPMLMIVDHPLPMPSTEVRRYWRAAAKRPPGFELIALVAPPLRGLMVAAANHLADQLIAVFGVRIQVFIDREPATQWLCEHSECGLEAEELAAAALVFEGRERSAG